eukprot:364925-Chlamydomonas_euryale.AAC.3
MRAQVFFDIAIDGVPAGRIVVAPFDDVSVGAQRFRDLAVGRGGVGYRLNRVDGIFDTHLRVEGVKSLSYSSDGQTFIAGGDSLADLRVGGAGRKEGRTGGRWERSGRSGSLLG